MRVEYLHTYTVTIHDEVTLPDDTPLEDLDAFAAEHAKPIRLAHDRGPQTHVQYVNAQRRSSTRITVPPPKKEGV